MTNCKVTRVTVVLLFAMHAQVLRAEDKPTLAELKSQGARQSRYVQQHPASNTTAVPKPRLDEFQKSIKPVLEASCVQCHGPDTQEGNIRIDTLDPDLFHGNDVNWWLEVFAVLNNGEMPPPDDAELSDTDRTAVVEWLSNELQLASKVRRAEQGHSSFRRMTRYEYNYALQDLLGLPFNFAKDLPPDPTSEDGFRNSSETLHMSATQFATYRESARDVLLRATVKGDQPAPLYWGVSMQDAAADTWKRQDKDENEIKEKHKDDPEQLQKELDRHAKRIHGSPGGTHYKQLTTGRAGRVHWSYGGAQYAWAASTERSDVPDEFDHVAIIPPRQKLIVELGDRIPDRGTLRVRVRASSMSTEDERLPSMQLEFGWQASNDSAASVRISEKDVVVDASPSEPRFCQWDIPLSEIYPRNLVRNINKLGDLPSPSEFIKIVNSSDSHGTIQLDYVEVIAPVYDSWPPPSHTQIFVDSENKTDEKLYAREILTSFLTKAWRRNISGEEVTQKLAMFERVRPECQDFQDAMIEVLSTSLASPHFLYVAKNSADETLDDYELATRLSMLLWCSIPDEALLKRAAKGDLHDKDVLKSEVSRMVSDSRSHRFSQHFVRQWLGMDLLDYLDVDRKVYPRFDPALKEAMQAEPVEFFQEMLTNNHSVLDFLHADYTVANERLARHYGFDGVHGNHFRRVTMGLEHSRGGLLTQPGLLAMNSDGKDSHPLKRGIWLLERLLNDPPPPPPPAVPKIDLADPEIAKLTLKQRMEDHRNQAACMSCHSKIDPWGIAFENFDAVGRFRMMAQGQPVDATSELFNGQKLNGMDGLKRFLLMHRQDQFVRALVHKMTTFALGRPLTFGDRASIDQITAKVRTEGDGLATMIEQIVTSDLFSAR
ncbi:MAG: DUF1592 domain-containing protein [Planctomycetales bacterium]|nr:DUF1592 domain-containing protein [Planctomycetales bacterium]